MVADFGLARVLGRRRTGRRRRLTVVGDPYLMAPEMAKVSKKKALTKLYAKEAFLSGATLQ